MSTWSEVGDKGSQRGGAKVPGAAITSFPVDESWESCPDTPIGSLRGGDRGLVNGDLTKGRGAGRMLDATWPVPLQLNQFSGSGSSAISRFGTVSDVLYASALAPGVATTEYYRGRIAIRLDPTGTGFIETGTTSLMRIAIGTQKLPLGARHRGDLACWRIKAILAATPAGANDLGLRCILGDDGQFLNGPAAAGLALRPNADNTVTFYARQTTGGGFTMADVCPISIDVTDYNCYEFRFLGATDTEEALVRVLINGEEQFAINFSDGILPSAWSFASRIGSRASGVLWVPVGGINLSAAPTEAALL